MLVFLEEESSHHWLKDFLIQNKKKQKMIQEKKLKKVIVTALAETFVNYSLQK